MHAHDRLGGGDAAEHCGRQAAVNRDSFVREVAGEHFAVRPDPGKKPAISWFGFDVDISKTSTEAVAYGSQEVRHAFPSACGERDRMRIAIEQHASCNAISDGVNFIEYKQRVFLVHIEFGEHGSHRGDLRIHQRT